jgi:hypothetical protein
MSTKTSSITQYLDTLEEMLQEYMVKKAPAIPKNWKELIVKVAPWITLVLLVMALPVVFAALGLSAVLAPVSLFAGMHFGLFTIVTIILSVVSLILEAMAIPGLFKRSKMGWRYVYYSTLVGAVSSILSFNVVGFIIGTLLSLYILFQVKEYYK